MARSLRKNSGEVSVIELSDIVPSVDTLQTIVDAVPSPVIVIDRDHRLAFVNAAMCEFAHCSRDELIGSTGPRQLSQEQLNVFWRIDDLVFETGQPNENEEVATDGTGALRVILTRKRLIHLETSYGRLPFIIAVISDVTRFREAEARAQYLAEHDALTGLANRIQLLNRLTQALDAARAGNRRVSLLLLDLDGFKPINDQFGHPVGDEVLRVVGKRLTSLVRDVDTVARWGGDEFVVVQSALKQDADASSLAERIMSAISLPIAVGTRNVSVSTSIGIAVCPDDGTTSEILIERADEALYAAKKKRDRGYFRYQWSGAAGSELSVTKVLPNTRWNIENDLQRAIGTKQIFLVFQPLADADDREVNGFEALVRWNHPTRGTVSPEVFNPAADSGNLSDQLNDWVLAEACAEAAKWPDPLRVTVNISPTQLERSDLADAVAKALRASELAPQRLELEIAEPVLLGSTTRIFASLRHLRELGVTLALDNFGASWLSLAWLKECHFDRIKIDPSFVESIETDPRSLTIVRAVLWLAKSLGVPVTAEGIEDEAQAAALHAMGCSELQGSLFSFAGRQFLE